MVPYGATPSAIWLWDESDTGYVNLTRQFVRQSSTHTILTASDDYLYIGYEQRFDTVFFWLHTRGDYSDLVWECWNGTAWVEFIPIQPNDWDFQSIKSYIQLDLRGPGIADWTIGTIDTAHSATPPNDTPRYWIRLSGTPTIAAVMDSVTIRPYVSIATPRNVQEQLQLADRFTATSFPTFETVEDFLREAEDDIYWDTGHYYRPEIIVHEQLDFNPYGMKLRNHSLLDIIDLELWNGNDWEGKSEGRNEDWHYDPYTGLIYLSTIFLDSIPPILRRGYSSRRQQGLFKRGIRVSYVFGHDARSDGYTIAMQRAIVKHAAAAIAMGRDFAGLIPDGLDRIPLSEKAKTWNEEVDAFKEAYRRLIMF